MIVVWQLAELLLNQHTYLTSDCFSAVLLWRGSPCEPEEEILTGQLQFAEELFHPKEP